MQPVAASFARAWRLVPQHARRARRAALKRAAHRRQRAAWRAMLRAGGDVPRTARGVTDREVC